VRQTELRTGIVRDETLILHYAEDFRPPAAVMMVANQFGPANTALFFDTPNRIGWLASFRRSS
jgi:hypothetical protein